MCGQRKKVVPARGKSSEKKEMTDIKRVRLCKIGILELKICERKQLWVRPIFQGVTQG